jgi:hypothetical protein
LASRGGGAAVRPARGDAARSRRRGGGTVAARPSRGDGAVAARAPGGGGMGSQRWRRVLPAERVWARGMRQGERETRAWDFEI